MKYKFSAILFCLMLASFAVMIVPPHTVAIDDLMLTLGTAAAVLTATCIAFGV